MLNRSYDSAALHRLLAHRHPLLLVDRVEVIEPGQRVIGTKLLSAAEWWAQSDMAAHHVRFRAAARAGDRLTLDVALIQWRRGVCRTKAVARLADGAVVTTAHLTTIVRGTA